MLALRKVQEQWGSSSDGLPSPWRRLLAVLIDWIVILVYLVIVTIMSILLGAVGLPSFSDISSPGIGQLAVVSIVVFPAVLYFAICEGSSWQATVGKRTMRLKVVLTTGKRVSIARASIRAIVKLLPWEIAHTGIYYSSGVSKAFAGQPFEDEDFILIPYFGMAAMTLALVYVVCVFVGQRRTPYDWVAGTLVKSRVQ